LSIYLLNSAQRHTVADGTTIESAAKQLSDERLTFLVVRDGQRVLGLVNERSFVKYCARDDELGGGKSGGLPAPRDAGGVISIMTPLDQTLSVSLTDPASKCIDLFYEKSARHLPVLDRKEQLVGIISIRDMLRPLLP